MFLHLIVTVVLPRETQHITREKATYIVPPVDMARGNFPNGYC